MTITALKGRAAKAKGKKETGKQTTLLGFQPQLAEKHASHKYARKQNDGTDSVEAAQATVPKPPASEAAGTAPSRSPSPMADQEESQVTLEDVSEGLDETQAASYLEEQERQGSPDWDEPTKDTEMSSGVGVVSSLD